MSRSLCTGISSSYIHLLSGEDNKRKLTSLPVSSADILPLLPRQHSYTLIIYEALLKQRPFDKLQRPARSPSCCCCVVSELRHTGKSDKHATFCATRIPLLVTCICTLPTLWWRRIYVAAHIRSTLDLPQKHVKYPGHFANSARGRSQLNTHAPYVCGLEWSDTANWCMFA